MVRVNHRKIKKYKVMSSYAAHSARRLLACARLAPLVLLSACGSESLTCTLIGDNTGLTVELPSLPVGPYSVEVLVPRSTSSLPVTYVFRCDGGQLCRTTRVFFPELITRTPTIIVTTTAGSRTTRLTRAIQYDESYPNGRACEPRVLTATVTADLPG